MDRNHKIEIILQCIRFLYVLKLLMVFFLIIVLYYQINFCLGILVCFSYLKGNSEMLKLLNKNVCMLDIIVYLPAILCDVFMLSEFTAVLCVCYLKTHLLYMKQYSTEVCLLNQETMNHGTVHEKFNSSCAEAVLLRSCGFKLGDQGVSFCGGNSFPLFLDLLMYQSRILSPMVLIQFYFCLFFFFLHWT